MTDAMLNRDMLWAQVLNTYAAPGVQAACLVLQEEDGVDVLILLFSLALGCCGYEPLDAAEIAEADTLVMDWRSETVRPLRRMRKRLKEQVGGISTERSGSFREEIKRLELAAEAIEFDLLCTTVASRPKHRELHDWALVCIEVVADHFTALEGSGAEKTRRAEAIATIVKAVTSRMAGGHEN